VKKVYYLNIVSTLIFSLYILLILLLIGISFFGIMFNPFMPLLNIVLIPILIFLVLVCFFGFKTIYDKKKNKEISKTIKINNICKLIFNTIFLIIVYQGQMDIIFIMMIILEIMLIITLYLCFKKVDFNKGIC